MTDTKELAERLRDIHRVLGICINIIGKTLWEIAIGHWKPESRLSFFSVIIQTRQIEPMPA